MVLYSGPRVPTVGGDGGNQCLGPSHCLGEDHCPRCGGPSSSGPPPSLETRRLPLVLTELRGLRHLRPSSLPPELLLVPAPSEERVSDSQVSPRPAPAPSGHLRRLKDHSEHSRAKNPEVAQTG